MNCSQTEGRRRKKEQLSSSSGNTNSISSYYCSDVHQNNMIEALRVDLYNDCNDGNTSEQEKDLFDVHFNSDVAGNRICTTQLEDTGFQQQKQCVIRRQRRRRALFRSDTKTMQWRCQRKPSFLVLDFIMISLQIIIMSLLFFIASFSNHHGGVVMAATTASTLERHFFYEYYSCRPYGSSYSSSLETKSKYYHQHGRRCWKQFCGTSLSRQILVPRGGGGGEGKDDEEEKKQQQQQPPPPVGKDEEMEEEKGKEQQKGKIDERSEHISPDNMDVSSGEVRNENKVEEERNVHEPSLEKEQELEEKEKDGTNKYSNVDTGEDDEGHPWSFMRLFRLSADAKEQAGLVPDDNSDFNMVRSGIASKEKTVGETAKEREVMGGEGGGIGSIQRGRGGGGGAVMMMRKQSDDDHREHMEENRKDEELTKRDEDDGYLPFSLFRRRPVGVTQETQSRDVASTAFVSPISPSRLVLGDGTMDKIKESVVDRPVTEMEKKNVPKGSREISMEDKSLVEEHDKNAENSVSEDQNSMTEVMEDASLLLHKRVEELTKAAEERTRLARLAEEMAKDLDAELYTMKLHDKEEGVKPKTVLDHEGRVAIASREEAEDTAEAVLGVESKRHHHKKKRKKKSTKAMDETDETVTPSTSKGEEVMKLGEAHLPSEEHVKEEELPPGEVLETHVTPKTPSELVEPAEKEEEEGKDLSPFISSGYWETIDKIASIGLSSDHPSLRLSRRLRAVRKAAARATGMHGLVSGKGKSHGAFLPKEPLTVKEREALDEENLGAMQRRIAAIDKARERLVAESDDVTILSATRPESEMMRGQGARRTRWRTLAQRVLRRRQNETTNAIDVLSPGDVRVKASDPRITEKQALEDAMEELRRKKRVKEIDRLIQRGQEQLLDLQCEKDYLQRRPNPLFNYTTTTSVSEASGRTKEKTTRVFNFPPCELVDEYLDDLFASGRLVKLNHTYLWKSGNGDEEDEEESIGDDLLTPSADARKLYENDRVGQNRRNDGENNGMDRRNGVGNGGGGSWLLRRTIGRGASLGEKIGEAAEAAAYKAVCSAVMSVLARSICAIHGVNVMTYSDIRLFVESTPDLPPVGKGVFGDDYAQEAIKKAIHRGAKRRKKRRAKQYLAQSYDSSQNEDEFMQRDAVVETLISHCQISAPLLKLFPLAWQRAMLGNIITLIAAIVSDFADGIKIQILGHQLSFSFKPITEKDMIQHIGMGGGYGFNHRRARPEEFEAAVRATAEDLSETLTFLDRWHERALGSGMLRAQIANLIARIVLTLVDEVLSGARMDLWSAQAGGPHMHAALEYRTTTEAERMFV